MDLPMLSKKIQDCGCGLEFNDQGMWYHAFEQC